MRRAGFQQTAWCCRYDEHCLKHQRLLCAVRRTDTLGKLNQAVVGSSRTGDSRTVNFLDIFAALLAWVAAAAWVLTGRRKLPANWDHLRTGSAEKPGSRSEGCTSCASSIAQAWQTPPCRYNIWLSEPVPGINSSSPWNAFTSYLTTLYFLADFFRREHRAVCAARGYREEQGIVEGS